MEERDKKKIEFAKKAIEQLRNVLINNDYNGENKELILGTYATAIASHFDDREPTDKTDEEYRTIAGKCWKSNISNDDSNIGKVKASVEEIRRISNEISGMSQDEKSIYITKYILEETRNALLHGSFVINDNQTVTVWNNGMSQFNMVYEFECICDVCDMLMDKELTKAYDTLIRRLKGEEEAQQYNIESKDEDKLLLFDLFTNFAISFNEDFVHQNANIINEQLGITLDDSKIGHIRNSVAHHYRAMDGENIRILDYKKKDRRSITSDFSISFEKIETCIQKIIDIDFLSPGGDER